MSRFSTPIVFALLLFCGVSGLRLDTHMFPHAGSAPLVPWSMPDPVFGLNEPTSFIIFHKLQPKATKAFSSCQEWKSEREEQATESGFASIQSMADMWMGGPTFQTVPVPSIWDYNYDKAQIPLACDEEIGCDRKLQHIAEFAPETAVKPEKQTKWAEELWSMNITSNDVVYDDPFRENVANPLKNICASVVIPRSTSLQFSLRNHEVTCVDMWSVKIADVLQLAEQRLRGTYVIAHGDQNLVTTESRQEKYYSKPEAAHNNSITSDWAELLEGSRVSTMFVQNLLANHPKLQPFPIGLMGAIGKINHLITIREEVRMQGIHSKSQKMLINFGSTSHFAACIREQLILKAKRNWPFATVLPPLVLNLDKNSVNGRFEAKAAFYKTLARFQFVISPPGSGWDCYRTWEALLFGTIPILLRSGSHFDSMYADLPVLFVNNYAEITDSLLADTWMKYRDAVFNLDKLKMSWWADQVKQSVKDESA